MTGSVFGGFFAGLSAVYGRMRPKVSGRSPRLEASVDVQLTSGQTSAACLEARVLKSRHFLARRAGPWFPDRGREASGPPHGGEGSGKTPMGLDREGRKSPGGRRGGLGRRGWRRSGAAKGLKRLKTAMGGYSAKATRMTPRRRFLAVSAPPGRGVGASGRAGERSRAQSAPPLRRARISPSRAPRAGASDFTRPFTMPRRRPIQACPRFCFCCLELS